MSICTFLAADQPLPSHSPSRDYPLEVNVDEGTIFDGDADDNFFLLSMDDLSLYTDKPYGVCLEWAYYTEGRANKILDYLREILVTSNSVELWHVWLMDYYEYEDRPVFHKKIISIKDLTPNHIKELDAAPIWNNPDRERPSFYCLQITSQEV